MIPYHKTRDTYDRRLERRLDLLRQQQSPVDILGEERVPLDLLSSIGTEALRRVSVQKTGHDALGFR